MQEFHDFIEFAKESVKYYNDSMGNGRKQTKWTAEEMEEIVIAQVVEFLLVLFIIVYLMSVFFYLMLQGTLLLLAGFDTTATALANVVFILAVHPDVQERLHGMILDVGILPV